MLFEHWRGKLSCALMGVAVLTAAGLAGCAASSSRTHGGPAPIPEGMGRLVLQTGGINEVNFYVIDQATDEEVYSESPRLPGTSPRGYERGGFRKPQSFDLPPGQYTVVVNTDVKDPVEIRDVDVVLGETRYVQVPVGRFQLVYFDNSGTRRQMPFLIYDYSLGAVLGRGMTSTEVRYFIVPVGNYKVRVENSSSGLDEIRPVEVTYGRTQNITIGGVVQEQTPAGTGSQQQQQQQQQ